MAYLCHLVLYDLTLAVHSVATLSKTIAFLTLKYLKLSVANNKVKALLSKAINKYSRKMQVSKSAQPLTKAFSELVELVFTSQDSPDGSMKNLSKTFPQYLGDTADGIFLQFVTRKYNKQNEI